MHNTAKKALSRAYSCKLATSKSAIQLLQSRHIEISPLLRTQASARSLSAVAAAPSSTTVADSTSSANKSAPHEDDGPIGIVMLNMGGPSSLEGPEDGVQPFLTRLFTDGEIIRLGPLQNTLGPWIAKRRSPRIATQYAAIGGKSPIGDWTDRQGRALVQALHHSNAPTAPNAAAPLQQQAARNFKHYVAFRYAPPLTADALLRMAADGVKRAVAFSQYPQYSCTTTGSSLNHLWREARRLGLQDTFKWSVIDRWNNHPLFIQAVARRVALGLAKFAPEVRKDVVVIFSAHSLPMMVVNRGDPYTSEVAGTVQLAMDLLRKGVDIGDGRTDGPADPTVSNVIKVDNAPYYLSWQSKVGFLPWMGPSTANVLTGLGKQHHKHVLMVPIAFTSDHIETLFEIDIEYKHLAEQVGIRQFERAPSLNDEPLLTQCMASLVDSHLASSEVSSPQYPLNCAGCTNPDCRGILNPVAPYSRHRERYAPSPGA